jgi:hypothetical protein
MKQATPHLDVSIEELQALLEQARQERFQRTVIRS